MLLWKIKICRIFYVWSMLNYLCEQPLLLLINFLQYFVFCCCYFVLVPHSAELNANFRLYALGSYLLFQTSVVSDKMWTGHPNWTTLENKKEAILSHFLESELPETKIIYVHKAYALQDKIEEVKNKLEG